MSQSLSLVPNILEKYKFDFSRLPERLKCVLCHDILKNAKQTSCGCKVCAKCANFYLSSGPKVCPSNHPDCADVILNINEGIIPDNFTNKEIDNLMVKCPFYSCPHICALKNMAEHIDSCEFREMICEKCGIKFRAKEKHNKCELTTVHTDLMRKSKVFDNINFTEHLKIYPNKKLKSPFHQFDCKKYKMTKENLMNHLEESHLLYISSPMNKIKDLETKKKNLETKNKDLETKNLNLETKNLNLETKNLNLETKNKDLETKNLNLETKNLNLETKIMDLESQLFKNRILTNKELFEMNKNSRELRLKLEKTTEESKKKSFLWKFTDFEVRRVDAESGGCVSITSDAFYTSEFGYKLCVRVYPAGVGVGKGTHLSVGFAIMKGEFDDSLFWPFGYKVTLSILDQEKSGSILHSGTFKPDASSACYQKPTDECNIAFGFPRFILLSSIMNNNSIYCKNDTIFLEIEVDTMGISRFES